MKLNPSKCVFKVTTRKFLGFVVSHRGIKLNPEKVWAILELTLLKTVNEVQSLNGKIAALNRFISKATDKCLPFFCSLKKSFEWTDECQQAFENLKVYLSSSLLLNPSRPGEELYLYLVISQAAVSAALVREEDGSQKPVYFTSRAFQGTEERYPQMEKLAFALVTMTRKLKSYFQAHTNDILMDRPLRRAMSSAEATGWMALWAIELSKFNIQYRPRTAIKGKVVVDFIAEFTLKEGQGAKKTPQWNIYTDGSSNRQAGGASVVLISLEEDKIECMIRLEFHTTNNEAKYEALIARLDLARVERVENMVIHYDSQVITSQVNGSYECKSERMKKYLDEVKGQIGCL